MYSLEFTAFAQKQFDKLPRFLQERIFNSLDRIRVRPFHFVKRKQGTDNFILRVGSYRVILDILQETLIIVVLEMGPRGNIYKK